MSWSTSKLGVGTSAAAAVLTIAFGTVLLPAISSASEGTVMTAAESDPRKVGWMAGSPPPADKIIRGTDPDFFNFPKSRWTVCHFRQLMPTTGVSRGLNAPIPFARRMDSGIDAVTFTPLGGGAPMTWAAAFDANYTDGIVVLHKGAVVYERYSGCLDQAGQHGAMSVTKSLTGLLGETLVAEGVIDEKQTVGTIIPELANSAFGDATVRQVLEMTTGLKYSEDYADPKAEVWTFGAAGSALPKPPGYTGPRTYWEYLQTVQKQGEHGQAFAYKTINTDTLGWIIARKTGKSVAQLLSERIWSKMGAEQDAYYTVDSIGTPFAGGGLNAGLRDMARIGQLMLEGGTINGQRLVPEAAIQRIRAGGDKAAFAKAGYGLLKGWSYRGMWWVSHNAHGAFTARGVHGQAIYVDPAAQMVIARFSSHPKAGNAANDPTSLPAYDAVATYLMRKR
ncbi:serine hydrolase domain-containing protein [Sphingomonas sp. KC8]|uniref:serine hydrolase domain-containing protein n=1 Tax=Sphingomonas sp. KC8 TaxID=1030157 RepID=UPI0002488EA6|nr:serine hydrolase [Sphingomonas sp. KC8]ARS26652.1 6-aminohexanoate hydrolase [Sphingomonas sp. KC8]